MKKSILFAASIALLASCANEEIVDKGNSLDTNVPIILSTNRQNITRASSLEATAHYNFGVWAWKVSSTLPTQKVMDNYLVGYTDQVSKGYYLNNATTWGGGSTQDDHTDHLSPWFYENLGTAQYLYEGTNGLYTKNDLAYMSANEYQYLRYWDLAYTNTNFYCYAPYKSTGVTATMNSDGTVTLNYTATALNDGYDNTPNTAYHAKAATGTNPAVPAKDRSLAENMYAGVQATNAQLQDVVVNFKHTGAQLFICFYEDVPGYKVEIVDLNADNGTMASSASDDQKVGVQATPSVKTAGTGGAADTYAKGSYYTTSGATVTFTAAAVPTLATDFTGATTTQENLMFWAPSKDATYATSNVPDGFGHNLTQLDGTQSSITTHYYIPESVSTGTQTYAWSPTIYYPVAQPTSSTTGFTFHVTYRIISDDNKEVTTVHNATVHVPASVTTWASNNRYIYTFKITKNSTGSTDPTPTGGYNPTDPTPSTKKSLFPIVFDGATIVDYTTAESEHEISPEGTTTY